METRIGVVAVLLEERQQNVPRVNELLSEFSEIVIGRLGVPYRERGVNVIALVVEGTTDQVGALTGKLGMLGEGVRTKSLLLTK